MKEAMMAKVDSIDVLMRSNPKAAPHEASIKAALKAVRELRERGVSSDGRQPQLMGKPSVSDAPKPTNRKIVRQSFKLTF